MTISLRVAAALAVLVLGSATVRAEDVASLVPPERTAGYAWVWQLGPLGRLGRWTTAFAVKRKVWERHVGHRVSSPPLQREGTMLDTTVGSHDGEHDGAAAIRARYFQRFTGGQ